MISRILGLVLLLVFSLVGFAQEQDLVIPVNEVVSKDVLVLPDFSGYRVDIMEQKAIATDMLELLEKLDELKAYDPAVLEILLDRDLSEIDKIKAYVGSKKKLPAKKRVSTGRVVISSDLSLVEIGSGERKSQVLFGSGSKTVRVLVGDKFDYLERAYQLISVEKVGEKAVVTLFPVSGSKKGKAFNLSWDLKGRE